MDSYISTSLEVGLEDSERSSARREKNLSVNQGGKDLLNASTFAGLFNYKDKTIQSL